MSKAAVLRVTTFGTFQREFSPPEMRKAVSLEPTLPSWRLDVPKWRAIPGESRPAAHVGAWRNGILDNSLANVHRYSDGADSRQLGQRIRLLFISPVGRQLTAR